MSTVSGLVSRQQLGSLQRRKAGHRRRRRKCPEVESVFNQAQINKILHAHNTFRRRENASDMFEMVSHLSEYKSQSWPSGLTRGWVGTPVSSTS